MCLLLWEDIHCSLPREGGEPSGLLALFALFWKRAFHPTPDQWQRTDKMRREKNMSNEEKGHMPQRSLWSSSEIAERWQQDVERRRQDMAEATQRMLEAAGLGPGDHVLDIAAGTGDQSIFAARIVGPGGSILAPIFLRKC